MKMKPKIYVSCYATGRGSGAVHGSTPGGDVSAVALAEDGTVLSGHWSSSVGFAKHDMGITSDWKHDKYKEHYPDGYELEWIDESDVPSHAGWLAALALNKAKETRGGSGLVDAEFTATG